MQVIINKEQSDLTFSFEGNDYTFPKDKPVQVEDGLCAYLKETVPLAFEFKPILKKITKIEEVKKVPTKVYFPGGKFGQPSANLNREPEDDLPESGQSDRDGIEFYGDGIEDDTP